MGTSPSIGGQLLALYRLKRGAADAPAVVAGPRYARLVEPPVPDTTPTAERPELSDTDRAERLALLAERLRSPDGLDHDTLAQIEQLTAAEQ